MLNQSQSSQGQPGNLPGHELWLVTDRGERKARWVRLTGLWPTREGDGMTGQLEDHITVPPGSRLVILPAKEDEAPAA